MSKPTYTTDAYNHILKDGHTMFPQDIVKDLEALQFKIKELESQVKGITNEYNKFVEHCKKVDTE